MKILSIETSCDDTSICVMETTGDITNASFKILAHSSNSQIKIHIPYGGVYPALAKREHNINLPILLEEVLKKAHLTPETDIDLITVTHGPGLEIALWTGIVFAKELAQKWKVPLMPANHMEGHVVSVFGKGKGKFNLSKLNLPALALLVSGGHTQLVLIKKWMQYEIIGETLDDAVGEAFDKVARMLELPYPGGPQISVLAEKARNNKLRITNYEFEIKFPRPMLYSKNFNFSYSGLKTAVLYLIKKIAPDGKLDEKTKMQIALEFENAAIECLIHKTQKALQEYKIKTLIVGGGVSANQHLRNEMKNLTPTLSLSRRGRNKIKILFPPKELTGDNSIMIGIAGYLNYLKNKKRVPEIGSIKATGNLRL